MGAEHLIRSFFAPVQDDVRFVGTCRLKIEVVKERRDQADCADDTLVGSSATFCAKAERKRGQVPGIRCQSPVVRNVTVLANGGSHRSIVKMIHRFWFEHLLDDLCRLATMSCFS